MLCSTWQVPLGPSSWAFLHYVHLQSFYSRPPLSPNQWSLPHVCSPLGWCTVQSHTFYSHSCVGHTCAQIHSTQNQLYCAVMGWGSYLYLGHHCISSIIAQCVIDTFLLEQCIETQNCSVHSNHIISVEDYDTLTHICFHLNLHIFPTVTVCIKSSCFVFVNVFKYFYD